MYTPKGAEASALIYSIVETAKAEYTQSSTCSPNLPDNHPEAIEELLPCSKILSEYCHKNMKGK